MGAIDKILRQMQEEPSNVQFADLQRVQNDKGRAKAYQVKQVLLAIERLGAKP
jgi:hypothetical protein